jgi:hypothetical protein
MNINTLGFCSLLLFLSSSLFSQTEKISSTFYSAKIILADGKTFEGIVLEPKDTSFSTLQISYFKYIKGRQRTIEDINKAIYKKGLTKYAYQEFSYENLGIIEVKKRKRSATMRYVGLGIGVGFGALVGLSFSTFACETGSCYLGATALGAGTFGLLGMGVGSLFSIRIPQKRLVKEVSDEEWRDALLEYSILR